jgi:hypothetical protein
MEFIRTGNLIQIQNTFAHFAPTNLNFVRGIKEDFDVVDPAISMEQFSMIEVAIAFK